MGHALDEYRDFDMALEDDELGEIEEKEWDEEDDDNEDEEVPEGEEL